MSFKVLTFFGCAAAVFAPLVGNVLHAQEAADAAAAEAPVEVDEALEQEIRYVEELIKFGFPDFAGPVIEATKKKWPESEARFFAIEIRGMLLLGRFDEAEAKIAALPDRTGAKYWAARLEVANNFFYNGKKAECSKIYDEFFKAFPKPTKEIREFYLQACYAWGRLLADDKRFAEAVKVYAQLLTQINKRRSEDDANTWCNVACETAEMYLKLATDIPDVKKRSQYLTPRTAMSISVAPSRCAPIMSCFGAMSPRRRRRSTNTCRSSRPFISPSSSTTPTASAACASSPRCRSAASCSPRCSGRNPRTNTRSPSATMSG